jgi:transposase
MELRADIMVDINDDAKDGGYRRVEVLTGAGRRRKWSDDDKARVVEETLRPGTVVADVARRWQVSSQQVFTWRREMRCAAVAPLDFVPIVAEPSPSGPAAAASPAGPPQSVEVKLAGAGLRVASGTDADLLTAVLRAIRASAA